MKQEKKPFKEILSEAVCEIVLFFILFGIGAFVFWLFGWGWDSVDGDLLCLIGIGVFFLLGLIISWVEQIKKRIRRKRK